MSIFRKKNKLKLSSFIVLLLYWLFVVSGINLSLPIVSIPDEIPQLLNVYGIIQHTTLKLPYESYYTVWLHYSLLPFTILFWIFKYLLIGMPSFTDFKIYVAANYLDVLPFLRSVSALLFIITVWLLSKVVSDRWGKKVANLFMIFLFCNLLIFINLHYSKHWIIDFSWIFLSIYLYWSYLKNKKNTYLIFSGIAFCFSVLSSHPLILGAFFHLYLFLNNKGTKQEFFKDLSALIIIFAIFFVLTLWLGPGKILSEIIFGTLESQVQSGISLKVISDSLVALIDYNPPLTLLFVFSLGFMAIKKDKEIFFLLLPFAFYLILISTYQFESRYIIFLYIPMALISAIVISRIKKMFIYYSIVGSTILFNLSLLMIWNLTITEKDTRIMALEWLKENTSNSSFVIYNTLGFNYEPFSKEGIQFIELNFPNATGTREKLHISLDLPDGINGVVLRRIEEAKYEGPELIKALIENGYEPILVNERFGINAKHYQSSEKSFNNILNKCKYKTHKTFLPFDKVPDDFEKYGDILYNFTNVIESLTIFDRPGPVVTLLIFDKEQPRSCK